MQSATQTILPQFKSNYLAGVILSFFETKKAYCILRAFSKFSGKMTKVLGVEFRAVKIDLKD